MDRLPLLLRRALGAALLLIGVGAPSVAAQASCVEPGPCGPRGCQRMPCEMVPARDGVLRTSREVRVTLEGRVLRYEVTEQWTNRGRGIGEADYVLPLPKGAAFEDLALEIDGEMVTGEALAAGEARRVYEEIVRRQRDPALVEWMGLGVLRTRIFPIQPGETRTVKVRFRAVAEREGDALRVDVPAPRGQGTGRGTALLLRVPVGEGFGEPWSPTHRVVVGREADRRVARVEDANGTVTMLVPVRDADRAAISVLTHAPGGEDGYALITLAPPAVVRRTTPRDITFVIDVSGSMSGVKLAQAKAAGRQLLGTLGRDDRFRLIAFSNDVEVYRGGFVPATAQARARAEEWLEDLRANGGTNIAGALEAALDATDGDDDRRVDERDGRGFGREDDGRRRQEREPLWDGEMGNGRQPARGRMGLVLFMTDGAPTVGERRPERIAARAGALRGDVRVFTFGVGADLNAALLEQLALDGAGTAHFVRPEEDVERVVGVVAQRLTRPVATDLRVRVNGVQLLAVQPAGRLDLFAGQELTILARYRASAIPVTWGQQASQRITITGQTPDGPVTWEARANFPARRPADAFVGRLWATQRVGWLSAERRRNGPSQEVDAELRALGERWSIPTELTSYLVLEPGMQPTRALDVASARRLGQGTTTGGRAQPSTVNASAPATAGVAGGVAGGVAAGVASSADAGRAANVAPRAGESAQRREFEAAKAAAELRDARTVAVLNEDAAGSAKRTVAGRTFTLTNGLWVDDRPANATARTFRIKPYSAAYFAAMERIPELRELFALGERVTVHGRAVVITLAADGLEQLDDRQMGTLTRDW